MTVHEAIVRAIEDANDRVRAYGDGGREMSEHYAEAILGSLTELSSVGDVEKILEERNRFKTALEYIANTPIQTEEEMVMQGHATLAIAGRTPSPSDPEVEA